MSIDFNQIDKNIYSSNSVFHSGGLKNTAAKVVICAAVIAASAASIYLVASGMPFPSLKSLSGLAMIPLTVVSVSGAVVFYLFKVNQIQKATEHLFDQAEETGQWEEMSKFLKEKDIRLDKRKKDKHFCDTEFVKRVNNILNDKENFEENIDLLKNLLRSYTYSVFNSEYKFLAHQILLLDEHTKEFILTHESPEVVQLIHKMMKNIRYETNYFVELYEIISEDSKKKILLSLGSSYFRYSEKDEDYSAAKHFLMALRHTSNLKILLEEIFEEDSPKRQNFREALSRIYAKEFKSVKDLETSTQLLTTIYPFLNRPQRVSALSRLHLSEKNPLTLPLWTAVVRQTKIAVEEPDDFLDILTRNDLVGYLSSHWGNSLVKEAVATICQDIKGITSFSLYVHFKNGKLSDEEKDYVKRLFIIELGSLTELSPEFLKVWMEGRKESIPKLCAEYIRSEPSSKKIKMFLRGLTTEQLFEWLKSPERKSIDFSRKGLKENYDLGRSLQWMLAHAQTELLYVEGKNDRFLTNKAQFKVENILSVMELLNKRGLNYLSIGIDLDQLWTNIISQASDSDEIEWMQKLYQWSLQEGLEKVIASLVYYQEAKDNRSTYAKKIGIEESSSVPRDREQEVPSHKESSKVDERDVIATIEELGFDSSEPHTRLEFRKLYLRYHPDKNKDNIQFATEKSKEIFPKIQLIINYMDEKDLKESPCVRN